MKGLSAKDIHASLSAYRFTQAKKLLELKGIRELELISHNTYSAYVDDTKHTYDVTFVLNDAKQIQTYTCECKLKQQMCVHIAAAYLYFIKTNDVNNTSGVVQKQHIDITLLSKHEQQGYAREILQHSSTPLLSYKDITMLMAAFTNETLAKSWKDAYYKALQAQRTKDKQLGRFIFQLLHKEKAYAKMIAMIDDLTAFEWVLTYSNELLEHNKKQLLKNMLSKAYLKIYRNRIMIYSDEAYVEKVYEFIMKHYSHEEIRVAIRSIQYAYRSSPLRARFERMVLPKQVE